MQATCRIQDCDRPVKVVARQLCNKHYIRLQRSGTPLPPIERFWVQVDKSGDCWEWRGYRNRDGYGMFNGRPAHRVAYERTVGSVRPELHLDHLCRNHGCVRPGHLRPRDARENMSDNGWRDRQACKNGHLYTKENTAYREREGRPVRVCRACNRDRQAKAKLRRSRVANGSNIDSDHAAL